MLYWCVFLFFLGTMAFLDSFFNYGDIFRKINSIVFLMLSLGLLIRTSMMIKLQKKEKLTEQNTGLDRQLTESTTSSTTEKKELEPVH